MTGVLEGANNGRGAQRNAPHGVLDLAVEMDLTAYDATYLWLARHLQAELVTLDRALAAAADSL
jgi:predicted nucleic acid-binding protein